MGGESETLRRLKNVQQTIPDKDFFANLKIEIDVEEKGRKKKSGLFSGSLFGKKKPALIDIGTAREKIKSFNNSFIYNRQQKGKKELKDLGVMSVQEMKDFRLSIKESAAIEEDGFSFRGLEAIVKFIDLKNSGIVTEKQSVLLDCLKNLGLVLLEDGGLSMFHSTWFLSVYREYLSHYKMFNAGEYEAVSKSTVKEARKIASVLFRKQYEIPHYLQLVNEGKRDVKQLIRYSKDSYVKRSIHGQKGCTYEHIKKIFTELIKSEKGKAGDQTYLNEVNVIICYGQFFSRIPMMHQLVDKIARSIPNLNVETTLYREKLVLAQKLIQLDLASGASRNDGSDHYNKKLFDLGLGVYQYCRNLITDNRLTKDTLVGDVHSYPFLKLSIILITYRSVFLQNKKTYLSMLENALSQLTVLSDAASTNQRHLLKLMDYVDMYERTITTIINQVKSDTSG